MKYLFFTLILLLSQQGVSQLSVTLTASDAQCYNTATGSIQSTVSGGSPNYSYLWSTGATTNTITNLFAGSYQVTVTDAMGTIAVDSINVGEPNELIISADVQNVSCIGRQDGAINILGSSSVLVGYNWSHGAVGNPTINLGVGTYTVTVTNVNGCQESFTYTIENPTTTITTSSESCHQALDGMASVQVNSPIDSLFYQWMTNQNGILFSVDSVIVGISGNVYDIDGDGDLDTVFLYIVDVGDTTGCSWTDTAYLSRPDSLNLVVFDNNDGTATAQATGGTLPYSYLWSANANNQTTALATGLFATTYLVTVTDARGCVISDSVTISVGINQIASLENFNLYPNPNQGVFQLELAFKEEVKGFLEIKDVLGKTIIRQRIEGQKLQELIQLEDQETGIYFLSLNISGQIMTRKIELMR